MYFLETVIDGISITRVIGWCYLLLKVHGCFSFSAKINGTDGKWMVWGP